MLKRGLHVVCALAVMGCAGELRDPGRFAGLFEEDGGTSAPDAAPPVGDASNRDSSTMPVDVPPPPKCVVDLLKKCDSVACHGQGAAMVNLVSAGVEKRLVNQPSSMSTLAQCQGRTLIATDGSASLLIEKLEDDPPCGAKMPPTFEIEDTERACLTDWVESLSDN